MAALRSSANHVRFPWESHDYPEVTKVASPAPKWECTMAVSFTNTLATKYKVLNTTNKHSCGNCSTFMTVKATVQGQCPPIEISSLCLCNITQAGPSVSFAPSISSKHNLVTGRVSMVVPAGITESPLYCRLACVATVELVFTFAVRTNPSRLTTTSTTRPCLWKTFHQLSAPGHQSVSFFSVHSTSFSLTGWARTLSSTDARTS